MKKQRCNLCLKRFANRRALGNHMRFHMMNLSSSQNEQDQDELKDVDHQQEVNASSSSSSKQENKDNTKRFNSLVDQESSFPVETSLDLLQESQSETESSMKTNCKKSKRVITSRISDTKIKKSNESSSFDSFEEIESVSSISEINHDEDVAYCLMMLSRDKWTKQEEDEKNEDVLEVKVDEIATNLGKYRCETCNKMFKSYQALGGHRANHKKLKAKNENEEHETEEAKMKEREHECPICFRVFASGQALGGHKRSHLSKSAKQKHHVGKPFSRKIDLNLPAPLDDDDDEEINQMELSAVSDAE